MARKFLSPAEVADILGVKVSQVMAILTTGELMGIQVGGRGIWRIEDVELDAYIERRYDEARAKHQKSEEVETPEDSEQG
ncbi:MAG: helix-turn-helix domain-containing protein [Nocardioidaceae bacterium]